MAKRLRISQAEKEKIIELELKKHMIEHKLIERLKKAI